VLSAAVSEPAVVSAAVSEPAVVSAAVSEPAAVSAAASAPGSARERVAAPAAGLWLGKAVPTLLFLMLPGLVSVAPVAAPPFPPRLLR